MKRYAKLYKIGIAVVLLTGVIILSCTKKLDQNNPSFLTLNNYFKNSDQLLDGTNAIYSIMHSGSLVAREWFFLHDLRSDDVTAGGGQLEVPRAQILNGSTSPDNPVMGNVWNGWYTVIHRSNTVITNAPNITDNTALRDRCVGEAKFLRGWALFELVSQ